MCLPGVSPRQDAGTLREEDEQGGDDCEDLRANLDDEGKDWPEENSPNLSIKHSSMKMNKEDFSSFSSAGRENYSLTSQQRQISRVLSHVQGEIEGEDNTFGGRRRF